MLQFFRNFFKSKVGIVITLAFVGLIAFSFASMDVANGNMFGGIAGGDRVALVGDRRITTSDLMTSATQQVDQSREQDPTFTMAAFIESDGMTGLLDQLVSRWSISEFAESIGLRAGDRLVDSEITEVGIFQGLDGKFSDDSFQQFLLQRGLSEATVREDLAMGLLSRQLVISTSYGAKMPDSIALRYAQLRAETRSGKIAPIPAGAFVNEEDPTDEQLEAYFAENRTNYIRPERRVIRYVSFGEAALGEIAAPTSEQIAARYETDQANYLPVERRTVTQLILPTEAAARALRAEVEGGSNLAAAATAKSLSATQIDATDKETLASSTSDIAADAVFALSSGDLSQPVQGQLGWYLFEVKSVSLQPGKDLAQATPEITEMLAIEQRREAINNTTESIEDGFTRGVSLAEMAAKYSLTLQSTKPAMATGQIYDEQAGVSPEVMPILAAAFEMKEGEPQIAETVPGEAFIAFDVATITNSATAPLDEIRDQVILAWRRDDAMDGAEQAAGRINKRIEEGQSLADALEAEEVRLPAPQNLRLARSELTQQQASSPVTMLMFSMAKGTSKSVAIEQASTWFVVQLDEIETTELAADNVQVAQAATYLSQASSQEYGLQLIEAIESSLDIQINDTAVRAVIAQLTGENQ